MSLPDWLRNRWVAAGGACLLGAVGGYGAGRLYGPTRIEERTKVEWKTEVVEKVVEKIVTVQGPTRTRWVTREVPVPGAACDSAGHVPTMTETEVVEDRGEVTTTTDTARDTDLHELGVQATERIVTRDPPRVTVAATAGVSFSGGPLQVGALVLGRVAGPVVLGGQVEVPLSGSLGAGSARVVAGLTF